MTQDIITREQIQEIKTGLINAKNAKDMKEYSRLSTILQKGTVAILKSHGINQIALKYKDRPVYQFIRIMDSDNLGDWGDCFLETCETNGKLPHSDDFIDIIVSPNIVTAILNRLDAYKELAVPTSEWHKAINLSKYSSK